MTVFRSLIRAAKIGDWKNLAVSVNFCPLCGARRVFVRLKDNEIWVRCIWCRASSITLSLVGVLQDVAEGLGSKEVYELSSRGPLVKYFMRTCGKLTYSEYFEDVSPGQYHKRVQCQDVQSLTYPGESFDVCTSTEVFEHVPDDTKSFAEIYRVLKPKGVLVFTVPLHNGYKTIERARLMAGGEIQHLLPPEYHSDPLRGHKTILAFRNYGYDILDRLIEQGFTRAEIRRPGSSSPWGYFRPVVVAYREVAFNNRHELDPLVLRSAPQ